MAIGWGSFSPNKEGWQKMWGDLVGLMKRENDERGGKLLKNTFISTHPYTTGGADGIMSVDGADWLRRNASQILGFPIRTLATEGGNPTDRPDQQQISSDICMNELRRMTKNPNTTQCFWIVADAYLKGADGGAWDRHSLVKANGDEPIFFQNMRKVAQGQIRE